MAFPAAEYQRRISQLQLSIDSKTALIIAKPSHIHYLVGLPTLVPSEREAILYISQRTIAIIGSSFLPPVPLPNVTLLSGLTAAPIARHLRALVVADQVSELHLDYKALFADEFLAIKNEFSENSAKMVQLDETFLWRQRYIKSDAEILLIRQAATLSSAIFEQITSQLKVGITEREVQQQMDTAMLKHQALPAFPTIVAFGSNGAAPHHQPTSQKLTENMPILIDWGCQIDSYCSDFTRSWWFGDQPSPEWTKIKNAVDAAYDAALMVMKPGKSIANVDTAARESLTNAGFGKHFIHTTGHSLGLEVHEPPSIYQTTTGSIKAGMVLTIEPGVYLAGHCGYRYENTILVGEDGPIPLG